MTFFVCGDGGRLEVNDLGDAAGGHCWFGMYHLVGLGVGEVQCWGFQMLDEVKIG